MRHYGTYTTQWYLTWYLIKIGGLFTTGGNSMDAASTPVVFNLLSLLGFSNPIMARGKSILGTLFTLHYLFHT